MTNPIFKKAKDAAEELRKMGHYVEVSIHATSWGNSAYVHTRRTAYGGYVKRGFRLSDHGTGDRRKEMDEVPTIIDDSSVTVADLVEFGAVSDEHLDQMVRQIEEKRAKEQAAELIASEELQKKKQADQSRAEYEDKMFEARKSYIKANFPNFDTMTKTKQKPIIRDFNKKYREKNPQ